MNEQTALQSARRRLAGNLAFVILQLAVVSAAVGASAWRLYEIDAERALPELRNEPLRVAPRCDEPAVVSDEQLHRVLVKLEPRLRGPHPKINHVDHALRFWGVEAEFDDPQCLSGREMRDLLLDNRQFAKAWEGEAAPLLIRDSRGVGVRTQQGAATASHVDHTLAGLAEVGTPLDYPVRTPGGEATVRDLLLHSLRTFNLDQPEYEWSALAYELYLPPARRWFTYDGQEITFDLLAERIMREPLSNGVCAGHHRLHALTMLLRVDEQEPVLSDQSRRRIVAHLQDATRRLIAHQHAQGYWDGDWPEVPASDERNDPTGADRLPHRILSTGHALEWWALAPPEVQPPRETVVRAGQWLVRTIDELDEQEVRNSYTFLTHAGRALALWRGDFPAALLARTAAAADADHAAAEAAQ